MSDPKNASYFPKVSDKATPDNGESSLAGSPNQTTVQGQSQNQNQILSPMRPPARTTNSVPPLSPAVQSSSSIQNVQFPNALKRFPSNVSHHNDREAGINSGNLPGGSTLRGRKSAAKTAKNARLLLYSTDDDRHELEEDFGRDYMEGYSLGLKEGRRKTQEASAKRSPQITPALFKDPPFLRHSSRHLSSNDVVGGSKDPYDKNKKVTISSPLLQSKSSIASIVHEIVDREDHHDNRTVKDLQDQLVDEVDDEDEFGSKSDDDDQASIASNETFTLRERQDAINITHPFGIRIWKPALYKKNRSVQRIAEGDIHSRPGKDIGWTVWTGNILWTITFGVLLFLACAISAFFCFALWWSSSSYQYGRTLLSLGRYLLFPFGKCVQLWQDEKYFGEDGGDGRTVAEYENWHNGDLAGKKLFFGPSQSSNVQENAGHGTGESSSSRAEIPNSTKAVPGHSPGSSVTDNSGADARRKRRFFGRGEWNIGRIVFYLCFYLLIWPLLFIVALICWMGVFSLPMAKVTITLASHLRRHPLALSFVPASKLKNLSSTEYSSSILLCTYRAMGSRYYKYTVDGTNIFFINLMLPVLFVIFDYYVLAETLKLDYFFTQNFFIFFLALAAVIPLAYFIGQAVASISAQTSMGMGATINAFFSTIVEVFLYTVALSQGKGDLVEGSIVGSIFAGVLLLPGLSMCAGAIKRKTQRYNPNSAGVSSTMLLFAVIGAFAPTIFYQIYGPYVLTCTPCEDTIGLVGNEDCRRCHFYQAPLTIGPFYTEILQPFSYICSTLLFISYVIGLWFTLRTHAALIWQTPTTSQNATLAITHVPPISTPLPLHKTKTPHSPSIASLSLQGDFDARSKGTSKLSNSKKQVTLKSVDPVPLSLPPSATTLVEAQIVTGGADSGGGHDAPNWSRTKSTVILLGATILYAVIAEVLVDTVDVVLEGTNISPKFLGITIFALVPNTTEFLNAISFAMNGNVSLSMEIGSAYALQVCLLQIPALVLYSMWIGPLGTDINDYMFTLIFPRWDLFMVIFCVFVFSYIYAEGKSNYFKGSILVLSYLVVMLGFYFSGNKDDNGIISSSSMGYHSSGRNSGLSSGMQFAQQYPK